MGRSEGDRAGEDMWRVRNAAAPSVMAEGQETEQLDPVQI